MKPIPKLVLALLALAVPLLIAARTVTYTPPTVTITSVAVTWIGIGLGAQAKTTVTATRSDGSQASYELAHVNNGDCQGLRWNGTELEIFTAPPSSTCASAVLDAFRSTTGSIAARLAAVETVLATWTPARLP